MVSLSSNRHLVPMESDRNMQWPEFRHSCAALNRTVEKTGTRNDKNEVDLRYCDSESAPQIGAPTSRRQSREAFISSQVTLYRFSVCRAVIAKGKQLEVVINDRKLWERCGIARNCLQWNLQHCCQDNFGVDQVVDCHKATPRIAELHYD